MYSKHDDKSKYKKKVTVIAGDSIINHLQGWRLSDTNNHVVLKSFSGATIEDMEDYLKPVIRKELESTVLHIGTNHRSIVPVLGALLNLAAGVLKLGAKAVWFLSENLWLLAVMIAYALYDRARTKGRASS